jgi:hypothetical protein
MRAKVDLALVTTTAPALADVLLGALGEIDALGKRVSRPPNGAASWEHFFSGDGQQRALN